VSDDDAARLTKALRVRGVSMRCPACEWLLDGPLGDYVLTPTGEDDPIGARKPIKLRIYACRNCGYVRLHSAGVLADVLPAPLPCEIINSD
jgi:rubredoxin